MTELNDQVVEELEHGALALWEDYESKPVETGRSYGEFSYDINRLVLTVVFNQFGGKREPQFTAAWRVVMGALIQKAHPAQMGAALLTAIYPIPQEWKRND